VANHPTNQIAPLSDFQNSGQGDYHLTPNATLIDKGTPIGSVLTDRDGNPRAGMYDIGAYELFNVVDVTPPAAASNLRVQ